MVNSTDNLINRLGVNVYEEQKNIKPTVFTALQTACICGESAFVENELNSNKSFLGRHVYVDYETSANVTGNIIPNSAVVDLNSVEVKLLTNSGVEEVSKATPLHEELSVTISNLNQISGATVTALIDASGSDGVIDSGALNQLTSSSATFDISMKGKFVTFLNGAISVSAEIIDVSDANTLVLDKDYIAGVTLNYVVSDLSIDQKIYNVEDKENEWLIINITDTYIEVAGEDMADGIVSIDIFNTGGFKAYTTYIRLIPEINLRGTILISYIAERHDLDGEMITVADLENLQRLFGKDSLVKENKLGYALFKMISAIGGGYSVHGISVEEDTALAHAEAINTLEVKRNSYFIVPLSFKEEIFQAYIGYANGMNDPLQRFSAVIIWTPKLIDKTTISIESSAIVSASGSVITDDTADFIGTGIQSGQFINVIDGVSESGKKYVVKSITATSIILDLIEGMAIPLADGETITYEIISDYFSGSSSTEIDKQAEALFQYGISLKDPRIWLNWPDYYIDNNVEVEGYFANASYIGGVIIKGHEKPLNRMQVLGFSGLKHSNGDYFKQGYGRHIHRIESGGFSVATQAVEGAVILCEEQWSSDINVESNRMRSVVRNRDSVKMVFISTLCPLMGRENLTNDTLESFTRSVSSILKNLEHVNQVGSNAGIDLIKIDPTDKTNIIVKLDLDLPYPEHSADIHFLL